MDLPPSPDGLGLGWAGGIGVAHIYGGTFNVATWVPGPGASGVSISDSSTLDITGGAVVITGNETNSVNAYEAAGRITAYGGSGAVKVDYNITHPGDTTITASSGSSPTKIISLNGNAVPSAALRSAVPTAWSFPSATRETRRSP